jgi:NAD(P)-dependent dehydrogenase (short-subunit alcohol dehydrogenase family)
MDLGLKGRRAIVCASSRGLGRACAISLAREGCVLIVNGIDPERVKGTAAEISTSTGAQVTPVAADISTEQGRRMLLAACPEPDILVNNNAGPQLGNLGEWDEGLWRAAIEANMLAPHFPHQDGFARNAGAQVRPHCQHYLGAREVTAIAVWSFSRRTRRADCVEQSRVAAGGSRQCHAQ